MVNREEQAPQDGWDIPGQDPMPQDEDSPAPDEDRQRWDLSETGEDLEALQELFDHMQIEQTRLERWYAQQGAPEASDQKQLDQLTFDETSLGTLKAAIEGLAWCSNCHVISRMADWWAQDECPHCHAPMFARFAWSDLRRVNPDLPEKPPFGRPFLMDEA